MRSATTGVLVNAQGQIAGYKFMPKAAATF
jgi:hypothetical protein